MSDCYIYYRVAAQHEQPARRALDAILVALQAATGITGHAYRKVQEPLLWMEVYTAVADVDALVDTLTELAQRHGLTTCLAESQHRHVEHFVPLNPL